MGESRETSSLATRAPRMNSKTLDWQFSLQSVSNPVQDSISQLEAPTFGGAGTG
jgi:hypothetical protein